MATLATTIGRGTLAARPSTMPAGSLYYVTDTSTLTRSNGATWDSIEASAAAYTSENARDDIAAALVAGSGIGITVSDPSDTITIAATGGAGQFVSWITGRYYDISNHVMASAAPANVNIFSNALVASPLWVPGTHSVDRIGVEVTSAAGGNARLGIYASGSDGNPGSLVLDAGAVSTSTTGGKELTISQSLSGGTKYWLVYVLDATIGFRGWSSWGGSPYGQPTLAATDGVDGPAMYYTYTYGALPSTYSLASVTKLSVPSSSSSPQRPQLE